MGSDSRLPVEPTRDGWMDLAREIDEDVCLSSHGSAAESNLIVELAPRPHALVGCRERERLAVAIEAGICNEVQLLQETECPERGDVRADFSIGRALFDRHYRRAGAPDLMSQVLLAKPATNTGQADSRAQAQKRLPWRIVWRRLNGCHV